MTFDMRAYQRKHYAENKAYYLAKAKRNTLKVRERLQAAKAKPCTDCGTQYPYYVMQFDHLPGAQKITDVSGTHRRGWKLISNEMAKCELVCANCHAVRTHKRRMAS